MIWLSTCTGVYPQYGFMFIYFQLVQKQNLPGPTGYSGIYIAFPLLRFQALFGGWKDF